MRGLVGTPRCGVRTSQRDVPTIRGHTKCTLNSRMFVMHLECTLCGLQHDSSRLQNLCSKCQKPLFAIVDLAAAGRAVTRDALHTREKPLWRYRELLPLPAEVEP